MTNGETHTQNYADVLGNNTNKCSEEKECVSYGQSAVRGNFTSGSSKDRYIIKKSTIEKRIYVRKPNQE